MPDAGPPSSGVTDEIAAARRRAGGPSHVRRCTRSKAGLSQRAGPSPRSPAPAGLSGAPDDLRTAAHRSTEIRSHLAEAAPRRGQGGVVALTASTTARATGAVA